MAGSSDDTGSPIAGHQLDHSPGSDNNIGASDLLPDNSSVPKPKRLACMICRKRKLKCDGVRPSCSTCSRLGHSCAYDEQRRKSGPKRGYVKALEERLKQVETLLKTQDPTPASDAAGSGATGVSMPMTGAQNPASAPQGMGGAAPTMGMPGDRDMDRWQQFNGESPQAGTLDDFNFNSGMSMPINSGAGGGNFTWEMIGLGLEEPLPPQDTVDELHQVYFEKIHPSMPMIHRFRYLAAMNLAPNQRPPVCLRYAMWTLACSITDKYSDLKDLFYQRARKYVEGDYVKGYGEHIISVAHCQTHILLAAYEMKMMYFPRAWVNTGSAVRLAQMIGLHRLDGSGLDVKQCLPPPKDWTEREERRRTFWMAFCEDRYASIGTGWPMTIDERDIMTKMPSSEEAFDMSRPEQTPTLIECTGPSGVGRLSSFGGVVLLASLFGRNLVHLHRPDDDDQDHDLSGPFWKRHRQMDSILLNTSLGLPSHLKLPAGLSNPNVIFTNMSIHTSTVCLHQAAIFKADKNKLAASVSSESKVRCITAANEIASIMRTISHMDLSSMNPFISFCLYVAARVFVQYLKSRPDDSQTAESLRFLLSAMNALKRRNPLTESFLVQLDVDFEALTARIPKLRNAFARAGGSSQLGGKAEHAGSKGSDAEGMPGILAFGTEDSFSSEANGPDLGEGRSTNAAARAAVPNGGFGSQPWLSTEQGPVPGLAPAPGGMFEKNSSTGGFAFSEASGDGLKGQGSPEGVQSNGPTPSSSGTGSDATSRLGARQDGAFSSRHSSHSNAMNPSGPLDANTQNFFESSSGYSLGSGMAGAQPAAYPMPTSSWQDMSGQQALPNITPVGEGVLRALLNMGPMDAMDLSSWDGNQDSAMRG